jgi:hypothetical protein
LEKNVTPMFFLQRFKKHHEFAVQTDLLLLPQACDETVSQPERKSNRMMTLSGAFI